MPNIFKRFMKPAAVNYVFTDANELTDDDEALVGEAAAETLTDFDSAFDEDFAADFDGDFEHVEGPARVGQEQTAETEPAPEEEERPATPVDFARVQAEAILAAARLEAEQIKEQALKDAEAEVHELYRAARADGYNGGFTEGMAAAMSEAQAEIARQAEAQGAEVKRFLDDATHRRDLILQDTKEDLRDLALAVAEKVIRISLKSSGDILLRMIETATEKHRRCEWVQIYIADCDTKNIALSTPELTAALGHLSNRIRIIPMADDESGTCIIEMPDEIIDASVSTQMDNIREVIQNASGEN
ncbi:MAG: F0F1 ATP synthase subunit delta [Peptococcaceae bacterium]|nr:F0F1 ATP synthase subunit delta [Peptococcaceae bacterium]